MDCHVDALSALPVRLQLDSLLDRSLPSRLHESLQVEGLVALEHVVDGPAELVGEDREGLGLAVLPLEALAVLHSFCVVAQEEDGRFGEGPLQVGVADLAAG